MSKTWQNVDCTFQTLNTTNHFGNSKYTITGNPNWMVRHAPVNTVRAPNQVDFNEARDVCYLQPAGSAYDAIMNEPDDQNIAIHSVWGDEIVLKTPGLFIKATRIPATGWMVFDCVNTNGILTHIHVGHAVMNLQMT